MQSFQYPWNGWSYNPLTSDTEVSVHFFKKDLRTFCDFCFLLQHKLQGDQTDADVVPGLPEPLLLIYCT